MMGGGGWTYKKRVARGSAHVNIGKQHMYTWERVARGSTLLLHLTGLSTKKPSLHESIGLLIYISNVDAEMIGNTPKKHDYHMCLNACIDFVPHSSSTVSPRIKILISPASP